MRELLAQAAARDQGLQFIVQWTGNDQPLVIDLVGDELGESSKASRVSAPRDEADVGVGQGRFAAGILARPGGKGSNAAGSVAMFGSETACQGCVADGLVPECAALGDAGRLEAPFEDHPVVGF